MMRRQLCLRGFTLLELLIAMTLVGMVLVVLYGGFDLGIKSWDKGTAYADRLDQVRLAQEFLRRQLRQSVTVFRNDSRQGRVIYFAGDADRIGWVAPMLYYLGLGGLYYLELDRVGDDDNGQLRLRWFPYNPNDEEDLIEGDEVEQTVLLEGVTDLKIEYFGPNEQGEEPGWQTRWENPLERPTLIKLSLQLNSSTWPELVVAVLN